MKKTGNAYSIIISFVALIIAGTALTPLLPVRLNPSRHLPQLTVNFSWHNATPEIIEQEITMILEGAFSRVKGINNIQSTSSFGRGNIILKVDKKADFDAIRFEISSIIRQSYPSFPEGVSFPEISYNEDPEKDESPIMSYTINASEEPHIIQYYAENVLRPALSGIEGIYKVKVYGASPTEYLLEYDKLQLEKYNIFIDEIYLAIRNYLQKYSLGTATDISKSTHEIKQVLITPVGNKKLIFEDIVLKKINGQIIRLTDVVSITHREAPAQSYYRINGLNSINIVLYATKEANQLTVSKNINQFFKTFKNNLPKGYQLLLSYDSTEYIKRELHKISTRSLITIIILLVFVLVVSRSFRYLLLIAISLFANIAVAAILAYFLKVEIHLYSLAGITVSLGLLIDNSIVMIDHIRHNKNIKVFIAILAATLTTMASLVIIFFLEEKVRIDLIDFAVVIIVNLAVSMLIALFFIPSLMTFINLKPKKQKFFLKRRKRIISLSGTYEKFILWAVRYRTLLLMLALIGFGLPVFLIPDKLEGEHWYHNLYNKTLGGEVYQQKIKPVSDKVLGGALRLFVQYVYESSYYSNREQTKLYINASMPFGTTLEQADELTRSMERYLLKFDEISKFQTNIYSPQNTNIVINFKEEYELSAFPFVLKQQIIKKAIDLAGADWGVYGVGKGFSNAIHDFVGSYRIKISGYNLEELKSVAETMKQKLLENPRIKEVIVDSKIRYFKPMLFEFLLDIDKMKLHTYALDEQKLYNELSKLSLLPQTIAQTIVTGRPEYIKLQSKQAKSFDTWDLKEVPVFNDSVTQKLRYVSDIKKVTTAMDITRENQEYVLYLSYDYIGPSVVGQRSRDRLIEESNLTMPLGYKAYDPEYNWYNWRNDIKKQYWLLLLIIGIIFFICSILFESLIQPLAVIFLIPFSYIGLFLTFYLFDLNFDQGGFAAFILLSGLTVNSALYIINDLNNLKSNSKGRSRVSLYIKAYNHKIVPIILTIVSTALGLIPFLIGGQNEAFWYALAAGTIGGLVFSILGVYFILPILLLRKRRNEK